MLFDLRLELEWRLVDRDCLIPDLDLDWLGRLELFKLPLEDLDITLLFEPLLALDDLESRKAFEWDDLKLRAETFEALEHVEPDLALAKESRDGFPERGRVILKSCGNDVLVSTP